MIQTPRVSQRVLEPRQLLARHQSQKPKVQQALKRKAFFWNVFIETPSIYFNAYVNGLILSRACAMMGVFFSTWSIKKTRFVVLEQFTCLSFIYLYSIHLITLHQ